MRKLVLLATITVLAYASAHGQLNNYKYIIVPAKFQGFSNENQFRTSTLVKYLFTNEGFNTVYSNNLPDELKENPCLGAKVELVDNSGLFKTKTQLSVTDCNGVLVMMSQEGETRTKDLEQAYREALSESFGTFRGLNYRYEPRDDKKEKRSEPVTLNFNNDVRSLGEEVKIDSTSVMTGTPMKAETIKLEDVEKDVLYAQPIKEGYQLVDTTPKVVYVLKSTSAPDVFLVNVDGKNGVVFKNEGKWYIEMDKKGSKAKELNIKF